MPQQGTQYTDSRVRAEQEAAPVSVVHHDHFHGMKPWLQRTIVGVCVAVSVTGLTVMSGVVMENQRSAARIEAKLDDVTNDFDRFVDLRYSREIDKLERELDSLKRSKQ